jgi:hypothetical protein
VNDFCFVVVVRRSQLCAFVVIVVVGRSLLRLSVWLLVVVVRVVVRRCLLLVGWVGCVSHRLTTAYNDRPTTNNLQQRQHQPNTPTTPTPTTITTHDTNNDLNNINIAPRDLNDLIDNDNDSGGPCLLEMYIYFVVRFV